MSQARPPDRRPPAPAAAVPPASPAPARTGGEGFAARHLLLDRSGVRILAAFFALAFVIRFFSPFMPDLFTGHGMASICVSSTPTTPRGEPGTLCGIAYPFQRGYAAQSGAALQPPEGEIFDEIYFGVFAHDDLKGISYFDPEPPLSKEIIAAGEWIWGWFRVTFQGVPGDYADAGFNTVGWRLMSCLFGSLCVPLMYLLAWRLWQNRLFAVAAGILTCFDGMFFVQSRIGMIDIFPIFLLILSYVVFLVHLGSRTRRQSLVTLSLTGLCLSLAIAAKWISLAAWGSILLILAIRVLRRRVWFVSHPAGGWGWGKFEAEGPELAGGARWGEYLLTGVLSFAVLPALIYVASWFPFFLRGQFHNLNDLIVYNQQSFEYHAHLTATHPYGSPWFSWPFLYRPVAYYFEGSGLGTDQWTHHPLVAGVIDLGNPWIWWASIPCLLALPYFVIRHRSFPAALILLGFATQYLPWMRITRVLFLYHMFGGLVFMVLAVAFVLANLAEQGAVLHLGARIRLAFLGRDFAYAYLVVAVIFFIYFYPVWTGLPLSDNSYLGGFLQGKMWLKTWI